MNAIQVSPMCIQNYLCYSIPGTSYTKNFSFDKFIQLILLPNCIHWLIEKTSGFLEERKQNKTKKPLINVFIFTFVRVNEAALDALLLHQSCKSHSYFIYFLYLFKRRDQKALSVPLQTEASVLFLTTTPRKPFSKENGSSPRGRFCIWVSTSERKNMA